MIPILHPALLLSFLLIYTQAAEPNLDKHIIPLYGNASLGYYYANLYIGNPGQQQSAIVDTGSGQLALPCSKCISCGRQHIHLPFDMSQSTTSKFITCVILLSIRNLTTSSVEEAVMQKIMILALLESPTLKEVL